MKNLSRRGLLKGALAAAGAAAGSRIVGPWEGEAQAAAGETSHFVHIFFNGGLNALFGPLLKKRRLDALLRLDRTFRFDVRAFFDLCSIEYVAPGDAARTVTAPQKA